MPAMVSGGTIDAAKVEMELEATVMADLKAIPTVGKDRYEAYPAEEGEGDGEGEEAEDGM